MNYTDEQWRKHAASSLPHPKDKQGKDKTRPTLRDLWIGPLAFWLSAIILGVGLFAVYWFVRFVKWAWYQ